MWRQKKWIEKWIEKRIQTGRSIVLLSPQTIAFDSNITFDPFYERHADAKVTMWRQKKWIEKVDRNERLLL